MDVKALIKAQQDIHGRMSRCVDNLWKMGTSHISLSAVKARINIIDNLWKKVEAQHKLVRAGLKDKYNESEYAKSDFIDTVEGTYVMQRSVERICGESKSPVIRVARPRSRARHQDLTSSHQVATVLGLLRRMAVLPRSIFLGYRR